MDYKILKTQKKTAVLLSTFIAAASLSSLPTASAADGDLDITFGTGGKVITNFGADDLLFASALQNDGKIVIAGSSNNNFAVARYNTNGDLDTSFDTDGLDPIDIDSGSSDSAYAIAIQSDGKLVVVGSSDDDLALARLNTDGRPDATFDTDGIVKTDLPGGSEDVARAVAIQSNGKIIVAGYSDGDFALARYNTDGTLDTTFNSVGSVTTDFGSISEIRSVAIQSDGKVVVAGRSGADVAVARYNTNGTPDSSFNDDGKLTVDFSGGTDFGNSLLIQSDGKIVVGGYAYTNVSDSDKNFAILRLTSAGGLDTTFDSDGKVTSNFFSEDAIEDLLILDSGEILAAGYSRDSTYNNVTLARYNSSGALDASFSDDGTVATSMIVGDSYAMSALIQSDGNFVVSGYVGTSPNTDFFVARYINLSAANAEAARLAAAAEAAKKAKEQKELTELLSVIPSIAGLALNVGDLANSLLTAKCVKGKKIKYVKKGAKCPRGYVKRK